MMDMRRRCALAAIFCLAVLSSQSAKADEDFAASFRLRGGFDSNPVFGVVQGLRGSAFIGTSAALAGGTKTDAYSAGVVVEADSVHYAQPLYTPTLSGKVTLRGAIGEDDGANLKATTSIADTNSYNLRSSDVSQTVRGEIRADFVKFFLTLEGGRASLNQTNAIFQDFLPTPLQAWRAVAIPGISVVRGGFEMGASVNLSARRYVEEFDIFGYRRDNERIQPFVFASYDGKAVNAFAAVSELYGFWHDPDFSKVKRLLYEGSVTYRAAPFTLDLKASRRAAETSFPISPVTIETALAAKVTWAVDPKWSLTASAGYGISDYLDSPYRSRVVSYGAGVSYDLAEALSLDFDVTRAEGVLLSGDRADAFIASVSLTKRFAHGTKKAAEMRTEVTSARGGL
jgi:hypothetical protein